MSDRGDTGTPPEPDRRSMEHVGMTIMLSESLGVSADAVRATAVSRAKAYLKRETRHHVQHVDPSVVPVHFTDEARSTENRSRLASRLGPEVYAVADGEPVEPGLVRMLRRGAPDWYGGDER